MFHAFLGKIESYESAIKDEEMENFMNDRSVIFPIIRIHGVTHKGPLLGEGNLLCRTVTF